MDRWFIYSYRDCRLIHNQYLTDSHPTVHRYTGNTLPMLSQLTVNRFCWLILDRELNITRPTYRPTVGDTDCQPIHHQYLTSTWPRIHGYIADTLLMLSVDRHSTVRKTTLNWDVGWYLVDCLSTLGWHLGWESTEYRLTWQPIYWSTVDPDVGRYIIDIPPNDTWSLTCLTCMFFFSQWRSQGSWVTPFVFS